MEHTILMPGYSRLELHRVTLVEQDGCLWQIQKYQSRRADVQMDESNVFKRILREQVQKFFQTRFSPVK